MKSSIKNKSQSVLFFALVLIPVAVFWYIFQKYALNIPHWDDYAVKHSVEQLKKTESINEKIKILFAQHNEHRIFLTRFFAQLIDSIKGNLDFKWLMFLGNLSLFGILFLFWKILKKYNLPILTFIPLPFFFLGISFYENSFWGMASVQNFWVILWAFLAFYHLIPERNFDKNLQNRWFIFAISNCFLGIFTSSNGILIPIIGSGILLFQQKYKQFWIWISFSILFLLLYFYSYQKPLDSQSSFQISEWKIYLKGFLLCLGSGVEMYQGLIDKMDFSMALGLFLVLFIGLFCFQVFFKKYNLEKKNLDLFLIACLAFILITCLGISVSRSNYGLATLLTSKYKIYSVLAIMIFYIVAIISFEGKKRKNFIQLSIFGSILFYIYSFFLDYQNLRFQHQSRICDELNVQPKFFHSTIINQLDENDLRIKPRNDGFLVEYGKFPKLSFGIPKNGFLLLLQSETETYFIPTKLLWASKKAFFSKDFICNNPVEIYGFEAEISRIGIKTGKYKVGFIKVENNKREFNFSTKTIDIQEVIHNNSKQNW